MENNQKELSEGVLQFIEQIINEKYNISEGESANVLRSLEKLTDQAYNVLPQQNQVIATTFSEIVVAFGELITDQAQQIKRVTINNSKRVTYLESYNFENLVTMEAGTNISGVATLSNLIVQGYSRLEDVSINGFAQLYGDLSVNGLTNMYDLSVSNMTTLHDVSINGFVETKQNITTKPYADISAFTNWSEWIGIYDLSSQQLMDKDNNTCDLSYVSTYFSTIPNQCISGNLNDGKFKLLTHDLSNILKNTLLEVNFSTKGIFSKSGSLELLMKNGSDYSIDARSVYPDKARTMCYGPQFFKTNDLSRNNLYFHLDLSMNNGDFIFSENSRLTLKLRNLL